MDLENILHYIAEIYDEDIEIVFHNHRFGIYEEFIEQLQKEYQDG